MLLFKNAIDNLPIVSLQTGQKLARVDHYILDPNKFTVEAFNVRLNNRQYRVLFTSDIKELSSKLVVIDDESQLMEDSDLVRLDSLRQLNYQLVGKKVETSSRLRLGKVKNWVFDSQTFEIQKLHVRPKITKTLMNPVLIIDRSQVKELRRKVVIVADSVAKEQSKSKATNLRPSLQQTRSETKN